MKYIATLLNCVKPDSLKVNCGVIQFFLSNLSTANFLKTKSRFLTFQ